MIENKDNFYILNMKTTNKQIIRTAQKEHRIKEISKRITQRKNIKDNKKFQQNDFISSYT